MGTGAPSEESAVDALQAAREALTRHEWQAAYDTTCQDSIGDDRFESAVRLDVRAEAAWWLGRLDECIESREAAFPIYVECGTARPAAQSAVWLYEHYAFKAQTNIGGAWLRRARRLLDTDVECVEYGHLVFRELEAEHGSGRLDEAAARAGAMVELGRSLGDADLEAEALQALGRVLIDQGLPREGLEHLDEAMLFAAEGKLGPYTTGKVYCSLISACEELGDHRRAAEWTDATCRWSQRHPFAVFPGLCRVHRAWALQWRGEWTEAEAEVIHACKELEGVSHAHAAAGFAELGEIRRRAGDLGGAEHAFGQAEAMRGRPEAGLALVRLAQGRLDAATAIIVRALDDTSWNRLAHAKLLPARVQIALASGDIEAARLAATELEGTASTFGSTALFAAAATARGRLSLAAGDTTDANVALRQALERWQELGVPYEVGVTRVLLGQACRVAGDEDGATGSFVAAEKIFEQLGATLDLRAVRDLYRPSARPGGLTEREAEVLRLVASGLSNKRIADELFISERTVARHISNIFTKIGAGSRSAATAYTFEHGLSGTP